MGGPEKYPDLGAEDYVAGDMAAYLSPCPIFFYILSAPARLRFRFVYISFPIMVPHEVNLIWPNVGGSSSDDALPE